MRDSAEESAVETCVFGGRGAMASIEGVDKQCSRKLIRDVQLPFVALHHELHSFLRVGSAREGA